ncbi:hypothetical protein NDU88_005091 [Pleurodeles waltl]|uniref:Uncharacterized protein n=1 Tax=Pleurodeles waltl TaxID=8319 RepID=A0AAV7W6W4_PLEWA|nr:hypothetical protein NDU88_005091 [Pleurodeles waltl]
MEAGCACNSGDCSGGCMGQHHHGGRQGFEGRPLNSGGERPVEEDAGSGRKKEKAAEVKEISEELTDWGGGPNGRKQDCGDTEGHWKEGYGCRKARGRTWGAATVVVGASGEHDDGGPE